MKNFATRLLVLSWISAATCSSSENTTLQLQKTETITLSDNRAAKPNTDKSHHSQRNDDPGWALVDYKWNENVPQY